MKLQTAFAGAGAVVLGLAVGSGAGYFAPSHSPAPTPPAIEAGPSVGEAAAEDGSEGAEAEPSGYKVFQATAYCDFGVTFSGVVVRRGIVAADPQVLPLGSVIEVVAGTYSGIYTVMDTGGLVKGHIIDIYMPDYEEAVQFGRQNVKVRVLRRGWDPELAPDVDHSVWLAG